jgi:hypothetical protein
MLNEKEKDSVGDYKRVIGDFLTREYPERTSFHREEVIMLFGAVAFALQECLNPNSRYGADKNVN